jgi:hypothetical protein
VTRGPNFDELIGAETSDAERERLRRAHELLLQAGPPPELSPDLQAGPNLGMTLARRRAAKPRAMLLLAAALAIVLVFVAGYVVGNGGQGNSAAVRPVRLLALKGTSAARNAQGTLEVDRVRDGNWPMTLSVVGLPKLPARRYYYVYLVRNGRPWGVCGTFRIAGSSSHVVTLTLTAPYELRKGDSWIVTRPGPGGVEPGQTVLRPRPVTA